MLFLCKMSYNASFATHTDLKVLLKNNELINHDISDHYIDAMKK